MSPAAARAVVTSSRFLPNKGAWLPVLAALLLQLALQAWFFPISELFSDKRLVYIDAPFHQYQMEVARALCAEHLLLGYDPYFAAGYQAGVTFNASAKIPALLACAVGSSAAVVPIYKLFSFSAGVIAPALLVLAGAMLGLPRRVLWVALAAALLVWWTGPVRWYHTAGLVSWVASAFLAIPYAVAAVQVALRPSGGRLVVVAAVGALGMLLHPLFPLAVLMIALPLLLLSWHRDTSVLRFLGAAALICAAVLLVNGPWLHASLSAPSYASIAGPHQRSVDPLLAARELLGIAETAAGGSRFYLALLAGAVAAMLLSAGDLRRRLGALVAGAAILMTWASIGGLSPAVGVLQPNRFSAMAWLVLVVPAAWGWSALLDRALVRTGLARAVAAGSALAIALVGLAFVREAWVEIFTTRPGRYAVPPPEVKGEGALSQSITDFLQQHTDNSARVYFETSLGRIHDRGHMAGLYALAANREFIGGPYPFTDFANAWDATAFGQALSALSTSALAKHLDLYNVKWMLCHSSACRQAMTALPGVSQVADLGLVTAYERPIQGNYFASGAGRVLRRCFNLVELETEGTGEMVLKYHWVPGMVSMPPATIERRDLLPGARPFIVLRDPPRHLVLTTGDPTAAKCSTRAGG